MDGAVQPGSSHSLHAVIRRRTCVLSQVRGQPWPLDSGAGQAVAASWVSAS